MHSEEGNCPARAPRAADNNIFRLLKRLRNSVAAHSPLTGQRDKQRSG